MIKYLQGRVEAVGREGRMYMECIKQMVRKRQAGDTELPDVKPKPRLMGEVTHPHHLVTTVCNWKSSQQFISVLYSTTLLFDRKIAYPC